MVSISNNLLKCIKRLISYFIIGHSSTSCSLFLLTFCNCILYSVLFLLITYQLFCLYLQVSGRSYFHSRRCMNSVVQHTRLLGFLLFNIKSALLIYIHRRAFALTLAVVEFRVSHGNYIHTFFNIRKFRLELLPRSLIYSKS